MRTQAAQSGPRLAKPGVNLPVGHSGSSFFHSILKSAVERFPELRGARLSPSPAQFKNNFHKDLPRFEAARCASPKRLEIAAHIAGKTQAGLVYRSPQTTSGQQEAESWEGYLKQSAEPFELEARPGEATEQPGWAPKVPFRGRTYTHEDLDQLAELLLREGFVTEAASNALRWIADYTKAEAGRIRLSGQRFALLGAAAELAPTSFLLEAGADVLWLDLNPPNLSQLPKLGHLSFPRGGSDILVDPLRCKETLSQFCAAGPMHLGLFAYAGGESQEWRLASTMNGIVRALPQGCVESISMWISPTSSARVQPSCLALLDARARDASLLRRPLGFLPRNVQLAPNPAGGEIAITRSIVPIQGVSYQAAQYIAKSLAAEVYATQGIGLAGEGEPLTVSANVAGITRTRSLSHPVFEAAFLGAPTFNIEVFHSETTRALSCLLMLHDLLNPSCPANAKSAQALATEQRLDRLSEVQVHGGVYTNPQALDPCIKLAAVIGLSKRPRLLTKLARRS